MYCRDNLLTVLCYFAFEALPWIKRLVIGLSLQSLAFDPRRFHVGFVVENVVLGEWFLRVFPPSAVSIIPSVLHARLSPTE